MPSGAVDGAVAGVQGGAVSSLGGGGTAVAGAANAIGTQQLVPVVQQLTSAITALSSALLPVAGGGASIAGVPATQPGAPVAPGSVAGAASTTTIPGVGTVQSGTGVTLEPPVAGGGVAPGAVAPMAAGTPAPATAPVTGGGAPAPAGGCGCGGGTPSQSPAQGPGQAPPKGTGYEHGHDHATKPKSEKGKGKDKSDKSDKGGGKVEQADKAAIDKWLTGDVEGLDADLVSRLVKVAEGLGEKLTIVSGNRTRQEQEVLYQKYLNGTGNLAAKPGTSNHEHGDAADVNVGGTSLANNPKAKQLAQQYGLGFPVDGEPWHVEVV